MGRRNWVQGLKSRWKLKSAGQVFLILLVFACTGTTVLLIKKPVTGFFIEEGSDRTIFTIAYWILVFPVYNIILLIYGFIFGQFRFFLSYEKKFFAKIFGKK